MSHPELPGGAGVPRPRLRAPRPHARGRSRAPPTRRGEVARRRSRHGRRGGCGPSRTPSAASASAASTSRPSRMPLYIGRRWVHDDDAAASSSSTGRRRRRGPSTPRRRLTRSGVTLRRRFRTEGRRLLDIADEALDGTVVDGAARRRLPARGARAQPRRAHARHRRDDPGRPVPPDHARAATASLVIQGGPGTGKTAVGLHRASWLLYTLPRAAARRGVLVVGPNRTFMEYVSHVLPALGEEVVEQRAVDELVDGLDPALPRPARRRAPEGRPAAGRGDRRAAELRLASAARGARASGSRALSCACGAARSSELARGRARGARLDGRRRASASG